MRRLSFYVEVEVDDKTTGESDVRVQRVCQRIIEQALSTATWSDPMIGKIQTGSKIVIAR